jgi:uncharacterized damage-inducible protein DinB
MHHARDELLAALHNVQPADWERKIPYGDRTLHELLAHLASADQAWAVAAQGLLKGESEAGAMPLTPAEAKEARIRAIERGRARPVAELRSEMDSRRKLLLGLFELLEKRHLALALTSYGDEHNSVRERIWLGYHDRLHAADVKRTLRTHWAPPKLVFLPQLRETVAALAPDETLYVIHSVDPTKWELPSVLPQWSNRNLLAHIATGDWVLQTHLRSLLEHKHVAEWPDVTAGNEGLTGDRRVTPVHTLIDEYLSMRHETMLLLARLKPEHLREKITMRFLPEPHERTVLDYLQFFPNHERTHREQLRPVMRYATSLR